MRTAMYLFRFVWILACLASLISVSGASASAGTPVSGSQTVLFTGTGYRLWSSDGWTHTKYYSGAGTFAFSGDGVSLSGTVSRRDITKADADGNGSVEGVVTYVNANDGVTCQGPSNGKLTNWALAASVLAHCSDGSTLHGSLQDTGVVFDDQGNVIGLTTDFSGTLHIPGR